MGLLTLCGSLLAALVPPGASAEVADDADLLQGSWAGSITMMGAELPVRVHFAVHGDTVTGTMDAQGMTGLPLANVTLEGVALHFERQASVGTLAFAGTVTDLVIEGTVSQGALEGTFALSRQTDGQAPPTPAPETDLERAPGTPVGDGTGALTPCHPLGLAGAVLCGSYRVPENRDTGSGRQIDLNIVVLPALEPAPGRLPLVVLSGGPGGAATQMAPAIGLLLPEVRRRFDVILVDRRGTGASNPLQCTYVDVNDMARAMLQVDLAPAELAACRDSLDADLTQYTTPIAMDDMAEVLHALGHDLVDVYGLSYGTREALVLARRHPEIVGSLVLQGVAPLALRLPEEVAADAQAALDGVFQECAADPACNAANPDLPAGVHRILRQLSESAVGVGVTDPVTGKPATLEITRDIFTGGLRTLLYLSATARAVPRLVTAARAGHFEPFARTVLPLTQALGQTLHLGAYLSVVCTQDVPFLDDARVRATSGATFLGDSLVRHHRDACRNWPRGRLPRGFSDPVSTEVPTLIFSGSSDPVTPPRWAETAIRHLPNSLHVIVPRAGHADAVGPCEQAIVAAFLESRSVRGLDLGCVAAGRARQWEQPGQ